MKLNVYSVANLTQKIKAKLFSGD